MLSSGFLCAVRMRALRKRVWFTALDRMERGIMDLTIRVVDSVRSVDLGRELVKILAKLRDAFKSGFVRHLEAHGREMALRIAAQAEGFGNPHAWAWARQPGFIAYLTLMDLNKPSGWGVH